MEWYEATEVVVWTQDEEGVHFVVGTTDTKGRVLLVNFTANYQGLFVHLGVVGEDADKV